MRKERISFSITNRLSWFIAHGQGVCTQSVPAPTLVLGLHAHTQWHCLPAWAEGWRGACTQIYSSYSLSMIDLSLSPTLDMSFKHELNGLNYVLHLQKVPN